MVSRIFHIKDSQSYLWANSPFGPFWTPWVTQQQNQQNHIKWKSWCPVYDRDAFIRDAFEIIPKKTWAISDPLYTDYITSDWKLQKIAPKKQPVHFLMRKSHLCLCKICAANHQSMKNIQKGRNVAPLEDPGIYYNNYLYSISTMNPFLIWPAIEKFHKSQPFLSVFNPKLCLYDLPFVSNQKQKQPISPYCGQGMPQKASIKMFLSRQKYPGDSSHDRTWSPIVGGHQHRHWKGHGFTIPKKGHKEVPGSLKLII